MIRDPEGTDHCNDSWSGCHQKGLHLRLTSQGERIRRQRGNQGTRAEPPPDGPTKLRKNFTQTTYGQLEKSREEDACARERWCCNPEIAEEEDLLAGPSTTLTPLHEGTNADPLKINPAPIFLGVVPRHSLAPLGCCRSSCRRWRLSLERLQLWAPAAQSTEPSPPPFPHPSGRAG